MTYQLLDPRHDPTNDEMRFQYPFRGEPNCEVRVPRAAITQGEEWVKARIEGWFRDHGRPEPGTSVKIPDYQFDSTLFQPEN